MGAYKPLVLVRADGGDQIGMGHIMRTLSLAAELEKSGAQVIFAIRKIPGCQKAAAIIQGFGIHVELIDGMLAERPADILITDSYDADEDYFSEVKKGNKYRLSLCVDDNNLLNYYDVDIIINQNVGTEKLNYNTNKHTQIFAGCKYAMLREEFRNGSTVPKIHVPVTDVLITMGGSDPSNVTFKIYKLLRDIKLNFHIVLGASFAPDSERQLNELADGRPLFLHKNAKMSLLMNSVQAAVTACGSTVYELAAMDVPSVGIITAENQRKAARAMDDAGIIKLFGDADRLDEQFVVLFNEFIQDLPDVPRGVVDGDGARILARAIMNG